MLFFNDVFNHKNPDGVLMNIAFVNATHIWSGVKSWCLDNAEQLAKRGHTIALYGRAGAFIDKARARGLEAFPCTFGLEFNPLAISFFYREFKRKKAELCVCNISKDVHSAGIAAFLLGIPIVQHLGAVGDMRRSRRKFMSVRLLKPFFITPSEFVKCGLLEKFPALADYEIKAIHPGCKVAPEYRTTVNVPRVITTTSRMAPRKGHYELLYACEKLKNDGYNFICRIVGSGELEAELRSVCTQKHLDDIVTFTGFVTDIPEQLASSDIYVFPAENEGLGIALEEAIASGLPCIAKAGSGPDEIWPQSRPSMLIPEHDNGTELYFQLKRLLDMDDESLLNEGREFLNHAKEHCNWEKQAIILEQWFEEILAQSRR